MSVESRHPAADDVFRSMQRAAADAREAADAFERAREAVRAHIRERLDAIVKESAAASCEVEFDAVDYFREAWQAANGYRAPGWQRTLPEPAEPVTGERHVEGFVFEREEDKANGV